MVQNTELAAEATASTKGHEMALLDGKAAVITGGTTGIGLATAQRVVDEGARVYITGRRQAELDGAVKQLGAAATGVRGDAGKLADLDRLYRAVADEGSTIGVVFANAAIAEATAGADHRGLRGSSARRRFQGGDLYHTLAVAWLVWPFAQ